MSEPHTGPWQLRFLTVDEELQQADVLSFLTSNGVGNQVTVEPGIQPDKQTVRLWQNFSLHYWQSPLQWFLQPVHGKKGYYTIIQDPTFESPPGLAQAKGSYKVILSKQPEVWRLEYVPIDLANGDVYKSVPLSNFKFTFVLETNFLHKNSSPSGAIACYKTSWEEGTWGEAEFRVHETMVSECHYEGSDSDFGQTGLAIL